MTVMRAAFVLGSCSTCAIRPEVAARAPGSPLPNTHAYAKYLVSVKQRVMPRPRLCANGESDKRRRLRNLDLEFAAIALPALAQCAAEPIAGLVDTAYLGRLGAATIGGAGVAISAHYATAKLFNDPLLRTSISLVATGDGAVRQQAAVAGRECGRPEVREQAVSAALLLAVAVGLLQALFFLVFAPAMISAMGAAADSPMRPVAISYLRLRGLGMPTATVWLVCNGIFRGLGDTSTPLLWALLFNLFNVMLDPILIFPLGLGAAGAAAGTGISQSVALVGLLTVLKARTGAAIFSKGFWNVRRLAPSLLEYGSAGVLVFTRTFGKVFCYAYCTRAAARLGPVASAAHLLCFNLGVLLSQTCEAIAIATQTLLARTMGALRVASSVGRNSSASGGAVGCGVNSTVALRDDAWHVMKLAGLLGGSIAGSLTVVTAIRPAVVVGGLTTDAAVRDACMSILTPVLCCQLFKGLAFPANAVVMGGLDWRFASIGIWLGSLLCLGLVHARTPPSLFTIWIGLSAFMASQTLLSVGRFFSGTGPWALLFPEAPHPHSTNR
eukprot:CAMPEP_0119330032 /NCGR_PEP_ID=MMETSP1333-20130426/77330_1 /TAXON_ID=418940 /ORGANISM="Scyphosphaera apsteinii, Strain RCC1455" /LENGTH=553 /DNA_ID=CAMNT_0007339309 /DNA_START=116 /DNA_END=1774 /DNA_ORIENTATION=-